ncbi:hypothetical protein CEE34_10870 [Candidatus Aerophobetes bacterium Ae_b3a]|nr:MAG: hypothetical protein CEE34_10870 [Candidatus Aerophobetes bacterium Ae_b3a]
MKAYFVLRVVLMFVLAVIFTLLPFTVAHAHIEGCAALGVCCGGCDAVTGTGCGGHSMAGGALSNHTAYAQYSGASHFVGFGFNTDNTAQTVFGGTGFGKRGNSLELTVTMADVSQFSDFLFSAKYQFLGETATRPAMAVGVDAINEIPDQMPRSFYIVASKYVPLRRLPLVASLGWGSGRFQDSFFGDLTFILGKHWSFIAEYDGLGGNLGISFGTELSLWRPFPVVFLLGFENAFASDEKSAVTLGAGIELH